MTTPLPLDYRLLRFSLRTAFSIASRVELVDFDRLPIEGPYILAVNHIHLFDGPAVFAFLGKRYAEALVGHTHAENAFFRVIVNASHGVWIKRGEADKTAVKKGLAVLEAGHILGIAPEGTRSKTGGLAEGREGIAFLIYKANVPVYPVAIMGTNTVLPALKRLRRGKVTIRVGEPIDVRQIEVTDRSERLRRWTDEIMCHLAALLPPELRGVYAEHPRTLELLAAQAGG